MQNNELMRESGQGVIWLDVVRQVESRVGRRARSCIQDRDQGVCHNKVHVCKIMLWSIRHAIL